MAVGSTGTIAESLRSAPDHPWAVPVLTGALFATGWGLLRFGAPHYEPTTLNGAEMGLVGIVVALTTFAVINYRPRIEHVVA
jgi:hypothetical protein